MLSEGSKIELTIKQAMQKAMNAHKNGEFQTAERFYKAVLKTQPENSDANHNLGLIEVSFGRYEEALLLFKNAIKYNENHEQYWVSYINSLIKLGEISSARSALSSALKIGLDSEKINTLSKQLNPSTKLDFFYKYIDDLGVFTSKEGELLNGDSEPIPLLTSSFLNWFETQNWNSFNLLELGAGGSTLYFSNFFKSVTSYETNQIWFDNLSLKVSNNVNLMRVDSIFDTLNKNNKKNIHDFDVILIDAAENRAKLTSWLIKQNYKGIIFFDNSEWYRNSINMLIKDDYLEIPFFGLKPIEDWVSCTSILAKTSTLKGILNGKWLSLPKLSWKEPIGNNWDDEKG